MNKSVMCGVVVALFTVFGVAGTANAGISCSDDLIEEAGAVITSITNNATKFINPMDYTRLKAKAEAALFKVDLTPPKYSDAVDKWDQIADKAYDLAHAPKQKLDSGAAGAIIAAAEDEIRCAAKIQ